MKNNMLLKIITSCHLRAMPCLKTSTTTKMFTKILLALLAPVNCITTKKTDDVADTLKNGRAYAEEYTRKNLSDAETVNSSTDNKDTVSAVDGWSISVKNDDKKVNGKIELKYKIVDGKNDVLGPLYYVVSLHEKIRHFFMGGWFEDMDAPVRAVVLLQPHDRTWLLVCSHWNAKTLSTTGNIPKNI